MSNILVIRGQSGCGKSTFAAALAAQIARNGIHTLLVSPDTHVPAFGVWVPKDKPAASLGKILENLPADTASLASAVYIPRGMKENLGLLGYLSGEPSDKYSPPSRDTASTFLRSASELAEMVIVDGTDYDDTLTTTAAKESFLELWMVEPTIRGTLFVLSLPPDEARKTMWIACTWWHPDPVEEVVNRLSLFFATKVPCVSEAREKLNEGRLFEPYKDKRYHSAVEEAARIIKEVSR
jgi:hypothetical protein